AAMGLGKLFAQYLQLCGGSDHVSAGLVDGRVERRPALVESLILVARLKQIDPRRRECLVRTADRRRQVMRERSIDLFQPERRPPDDIIAGRGDEFEMVRAVVQRFLAFLAEDQVASRLQLQILETWVLGLARRVQGCQAGY